MLENLNQNKTLDSKNDIFGSLAKFVVTVFLAVFPWLVLPNSIRPLEFSREVALFVIAGLLVIVWLGRNLKRREI